MARTTGKSGFKMRSGHKTTFKMMGSSPLKTDPADELVKDKDVETKEGDPLTVSNWLKSESEYKKLKKSTGRDKLVELQKRYGTTFSKDKDGVFRNPDGKTPSELEDTRLEPVKDSPVEASQQAGAIVRRERHMI